MFSGSPKHDTLLELAIQKFANLWRVNFVVVGNKTAAGRFLSFQVAEMVNY